MKPEDEIMTQVKKIYADEIENPDLGSGYHRVINKRRPSIWCWIFHRTWWIWAPQWIILPSGTYKTPVYCTKCGGCWPG